MAGIEPKYIVVKTSYVETRLRNIILKVAFYCILLIIVDMFRDNSLKT